jgi:hypothetical protein
VYVNACVNVVHHVPSNVVRVFVNYKIIAAVPAPVRANRPVPIRHLEIESAGESEAVMVAIHPLDVVTVRRAEMLKVAMLERTVNVVTLVVRAIVPIPMVVADVLGLVDFAVRVAIHFRVEV